MIRFKYRYCKVHMARFVAGDLSLAARRRIGRYIDECPDCRRLYNRHRDFNHNLSRQLPALGSPSQRQLDNMWTALQGELFAPKEPSAAIGDFARRNSLPFSYGLAAVAICLAMLLPIALGYGGALGTMQMPAAPQLISLAKTPQARAAGDSTAAATALPALANHPQPVNTPEPR